MFNLWRNANNGFVPARLRQAREVRAMSRAELARRSNEQYRRVLAYESGKAVPTPSVQQTLAWVLRVPRQLFYKPMLAADRAPIFICGSGGCFARTHPTDTRDE